MKEYNLMIGRTSCTKTTTIDLVVGDVVCATAQDDGGNFEDVSGKITEILSCDVLC